MEFMHPKDIRAQARQKITQITSILVPETERWDVINPLTENGNIGIELGVAAGSFSTRMVHSGRFKQYFGVDIYGDGHNVKEYKKALLAVGLNENFHLLRMTFDQALDLFPDNYFDFIYCDGYAHTGEEGGRTLIDWYPKLKIGGVMAGDDYDVAAWPLVVWAVNNVVVQLKVPLMVTDKVSDQAYNRYRSWYFVKPPGDVMPKPVAQLQKVGDAEKARIAALRQAKRRARRLAAAQSEVTPGTKA